MNKEFSTFQSLLCATFLTWSHPERVFLCVLTTLKNFNPTPTLLPFLLFALPKSFLSHTPFHFQTNWEEESIYCFFPGLREPAHCSPGAREVRELRGIMVDMGVPMPPGCFRRHHHVQHPMPTFLYRVKVHWAARHCCSTAGNAPQCHELISGWPVGALDIAIMHARIVPTLHWYLCAHLPSEFGDARTETFSNSEF